MDVEEYDGYKITYIATAWLEAEKVRYLLYKVERGDVGSEYAFSVSEFTSQLLENMTKDISVYKRLALEKIKKTLDEVGWLANQTLICKFDDRDLDLA